MASGKASKRSEFNGGKGFRNDWFGGSLMGRGVRLSNVK